MSERRALMAYLIDRQEQYEPSHHMQARIGEWLGEIAEGQHVASWEHGEYDDLKDRVNGIIKSHAGRESPTAPVDYEFCEHADADLLDGYKARRGFMRVNHGRWRLGWWSGEVQSDVFPIEYRWLKRRTKT